MGVIRCQNGHFYDNEKFRHCPHCDQHSAFQRNNAYTDIDASGKSGSVSFANVAFTIQPQAQTAVPPAAMPQRDEDLALTIGVLQNQDFAPAVGFTVILNGKRRGKDFTLRGGVNPVTDFCETPEERAVKIVYDPRGNQYLLEAENTAMRILLNGEQIQNKVTPFRQKSTLTCGDTKIMILPLCDGDFQWEEE